MRIVYAGAYLPWPPNTGGRIRSYHLLERLAAANEVHLLAPDERRPKDLQPELVRLCASVVVVPAPQRHAGLRGRLERLVWSPEDIVITRRSVALVRELRRLVSDARCDLVFLDDLGAMRYLAPPGRMPTVLSKHNVERRLLERLAANKRDPAARVLGRLEAAVVRRQEARAAEMADAMILPSVEDRAALAEYAPNVRAHVVPNGVDTLRIRPQPRCASDDHTLLFVGALFWYPNVEGLTWFVRDVLPLVRREAPEVRLLVVGSDPAPAACALSTHPGVEWIGPVEDVGPFLARAGCCVVPLHSGSGTRLKVLEALAAGRAVVSTTIGVEGLGLRPNDECLIADTPGEFAAAVLRVLTDRALCETLQRAGRLAAETRFAWPIALRDLDAICREAAGR